jgi:hypothetical protein
LTRSAVDSIMKSRFFFVGWQALGIRPADAAAKTPF